jgi:hypothetical protein
MGLQLWISARASLHQIPMRGDGKAGGNLLRILLRSIHRGVRRGANVQASSSLRSLRLCGESKEAAPVRRLSKYPEF